MGAVCSVRNNVVEPLPVIKDGVEYNLVPLPVVGVRGIRSLREIGSEYWGEKYVGDE